MSRRFTEMEITARIVATMLRWPADGKTLAWDRLRECVDALRGLVYSVDAHCLEAEQDQDLSAEGMIRRRTKIGLQALSELGDFKLLQLAEKAVTQNVAQLEERMVDLPSPTGNTVDFMFGKEIRGFVSKQKSSIEFVLKSISDRRLLSAILNAPPYLSGLRDTEWNVVRERARAALHPQQSEMQQWLKKALAEVGEGVAAAKRMILARCEMREDGEGQFRAIREPKAGANVLPRKDAAA